MFTTLDLSNSYLQTGPAQGGGGGANRAIARAHNFGGPINYEKDFFTIY